MGRFGPHANHRGQSMENIALDHITNDTKGVVVNSSITRKPLSLRHAQLSEEYDTMYITYHFSYSSLTRSLVKEIVVTISIDEAPPTGKL